jgi:epoxyqueuosine reductase QueG
MAAAQTPEVLLAERLRGLAVVSGAALVGFAELGDAADAALRSGEATRRRAPLPGAAAFGGRVPSLRSTSLPRAVVIAMRHSPEVFAPPDEMPTFGYYQEYLSLNTRLDEIAGILAEVLAAEGHAVSVNPATLGNIDPETLSAPFSHKMAATLAGLGWIGKSALLVTHEFGPPVRLTTLLTDAPLATGPPTTASQCGGCTVCEEACPAGAILGEEWYPGRPREEIYDAFACRQTALARAQAKGINQTICGICMMVCPRRR